VIAGLVLIGIRESADRCKILPLPLREGEAFSSSASLILMRTGDAPGHDGDEEECRELNRLLLGRS
jgi:hypothetical protein